MTLESITKELRNFKAQAAAMEHWASDIIIKIEGKKNIKASRKKGLTDEEKAKLIARRTHFMFKK